MPAVLRGFRCQSSPFSGSNKELGDEIREGLQACFKQVNEAGGVNGRALELVALDDANDTKRAGENAKILIEQRGALAPIRHASAPPNPPPPPSLPKGRGALLWPLSRAHPHR